MHTLAEKQTSPARQVGTLGVGSNHDVKSWTYMILLMLVVQNMASIILQHSLQSQPSSKPDRYEPLSGIVVIEVAKFIISLLVIVQSETTASIRSVAQGTVLNFSNDATAAALLFTAATILQSVGAHYLDLISYLVLSQLKTIVTPLFARIILHQRYPLRNWLFITMMVLGIVLAQLGAGSAKTSTQGFRTQAMARGAIAMILAGICVALGSLCIERTLKKSGLLFHCNAQLAAYSSSFAMLYFCWQTKFSFDHFFRGFDALAWIYIGLQVSGGFIVAKCVQMTSTVTKNYAQGLGFALAVFTPPLVAGQHISFQLLIGVGLILASVLGSSASNQKKPATEEVPSEKSSLQEHV
ncbi:Nucleotide-sugar transporter [Penicillium ucsense]|nr:Nucleotide-sugar transporter [Penicillium ucsense]